MRREKKMTEEMREQRRKECLKKCGTLLARRDYTCARLREKLLTAGFEEEVVSEAIDSLIKARYLDDERYARNFIAAHGEDRSRLRIRMDLEERGVPSETLSEVLREESEERGEEAEIRQIRRLMEKRKFDPENADWDEKRRMQAYLYRKGYGASSVRAAMNGEP